MWSATCSPAGTESAPSGRAKSFWEATMISASGTTGLDRRSHVVLAVARLDGALHLLGDRGQRTEPQPLLLGGGKRQPGVFERELERERRRVVALHHQLALQVRVGRSHRA